MEKNLIHIHSSITKKNPSKKLFWVTYKSKNGEVVSVSETETTKVNVKKNIKAMAKIFEHRGQIRVMDNTLKKPKEIYI